VAISGFLCLVLKKPSPKDSLQVRNGEDLYSLTPVNASEQSTPGAVQPTWIRLPKSGNLCPYTGISRSKMNELVLGSNAPVKSVSLKKRYAVRGTRLVHLGSLLAYIEAMATSQNKVD
jgi:hypothetical protein